VELKRRIIVPSVLALAGLGLALALTSSHAQATGLTYHRLNKIQRRIISSTLANFLQSNPNRATTRTRALGSDEGRGPDGLATAPPASYANAGGAASGVANFSPNGGSAAGCAAKQGNNVKVNQGCLNISDSNLQGRGQANNETSIAQDPSRQQDLVASDNNYFLGDGTCGAYYSTDGGSHWGDAVVPGIFTLGPSGSPRQYWQGGGDTSVAWDTRGNSYLSCQRFNRGTSASDSPDDSSTFVIFRSTGNNGASYNFPGRYSTPPEFDPAGTGGVLIDKALLAIDDNVSSTYRDRIYVTWTQFAADGTAYIYETHSSDYGQTFSAPVLVSASNAACTNTFGAATPQGTCNENQFSDPFVGPDGSLYVVYDNFNNQPTSGNANQYEVMLAKSTDGGQSFSAPVVVSNYNDLPDCDTYQGNGADSFRSCVPEKGSSNISVFRATNYPSGAADPKNPNRVAITFGSYINADSNPSNGCTPAGFAADGNPMYTGVKTPGACANKILLAVSTNGGQTFGSTDPTTATVIPQSAAQAHTDQWFQWAAFTRQGRLAVDYYDRQYGNDETNGSSDLTLSGSDDLVHFGSTRVTTSSMPAPTEFEGPNGGQFYGDYIGLAATDNGQAHPIWSDTRSEDLFVCPGTATPGSPPALCTGTEANGQQANDEDTFTAQLGVPNGH
jgi:hypothetical protein